MASLSDLQKKFYAKQKDYFQKELGFRSFRQIPTQRIAAEIAAIKKTHGSGYGNCILAIQCVVSFFPKPMHANPLAKLWALHRLSHGKTTLSTYIKSQLAEYSKLVMPELLENVHNISDLAYRMGLGVNLLFPEGEVELYFKLYLQKFANLFEFFVEGEVALPDAIMDDIWIARNYDLSLPIEIYIMAIEIERWLVNNDTLMTKDIIFHYFQQEKEGIRKRYSKFTLSWLDDKNGFDQSWKKLAQKGAKIWALLRTDHPNFSVYYAHIQTSQNFSIKERELLKIYFDIVQFQVVNQEYSQDVGYWTFSGMYHDEMQIKRFLEGLKSSEIIIDYHLSYGELFTNHTNYDSEFSLKSNMQISVSVSDKKNDRTLELNEMIIIQFYWMNLGTIDFEITHSFRNYLEQRRQYNNRLFETIGKFSNEFELDSILVPESVLHTRDFVISDLLNSLRISSIDALVFFEVLLKLVTMIYQNQEKLHFDVQYQKKILDTFIESLGNEFKDLQSQFDIEIILQYLLSAPDIISNCYEQLQTIVGFLYSILYPAQYKRDSIREINGILDKWISLSDTELSSILERIGEKLIRDGILTRMFTSSFRSSVTDHECNLLFHPSYSRRDIEKIAGKCSTNNIIRNTDKYSTVSTTALPNSHKAIWYAGQNNIWSYNQYFEPNNLSRVRIDLTEYYDWTTGKCYDFPFDDLSNTMKKFAKGSGTIKKKISDLPIHLSSPSDTLASNVSRLVTTNPLDTFPEFSEWKKFDEILKRFYEQPSFLFDKSQKLLKDIQIKINWPVLGLRQYFALGNICKPEFAIKSEKYQTTEKLLFPGIYSIHSSSNSMYTNKYIFRYIFPDGNINSTMFNYLRKRNLISDFKLLKVMKRHWHVNTQDYIDFSTLTTSFGVLSSLVKKSYSNSKYQFPITTIQHAYPEVDTRISPDTEEFQLFQKLHGKNLRSYPDIRRQRYLESLPEHSYWIEPQISYFYKFPYHACVFLSPLSRSQVDLFIRVFSLLPYVRIYECQEYDDPNKQCIFADLFFFRSHISQFYFFLKELIIQEDISEYRYIPNVIPLSYYDCGENISYYIPSIFNAHKWNSRLNEYQTDKYFDLTGKPLDIREIYSKISLRR